MTEDLTIDGDKDDAAAQITIDSNEAIKSFGLWVIA